MNKLFKKFSFQVWNIGFLPMSEEEFLARKSLGEPVWLKHDFRDRFFADPFFLSIDGKIAKVLVEEEIFLEGKGRLVCLTCDMETGKLLNRKVVLDLPTHLSYPQIIREKNRGGYGLSQKTPEAEVSVPFSTTSKPTLPHSTKNSSTSHLPTQRYSSTVANGGASLTTL